MNALIWKEVRENFKWAVAAVLLFVVYVANSGVCLCDGFFMVVTFISAAFGGALGILQTLFESHGDRRSLLLHRPLSATRIFLAKTIAGGGLYVVAMGIPLTAYVFWKLLPGQVAPHLPLSVRWELLVPWVADILQGLIYYFAGMLAGLRRARWYGSRCLGFPVAMLGTFLVWNVGDFWQAMLAIVVLGCMIALAAWGSFLTGGDYKPQPRLAKVGLAFTLLTGLIVLSVQAKTIAESFLINANARSVHSNYVLDRDGRFLIVRWQQGQDAEVTDADGRVLKDFQGNYAKVYADLARITAPAMGAETYGFCSYRSYSRLIIPIVNKSTPPGESWAYVPALGRLVGIDRESRQLIGSFGPDGFTALGEWPAARFTGKLAAFNGGRISLSQGPDYLAFPDGVYLINFQRRTVQKLFTPAAGEKVCGAQEWKDKQVGPGASVARDEIPGMELIKRNDFPESPDLVVKTDRAIYLLDHAGATLFSVPLIEEFKDSYGAAIAKLDNPPRFVVRYNPSVLLGLAARETLPRYLVEFDASGKELARRTFPALPVEQPAMIHQPWFGLATSPVEAALLLGAVDDSLNRTERRRSGELSKLSGALFEFAYPILPEPVHWKMGLRSLPVRFYFVGLAINALLGGIGCWIASRRYALSRGRRLGWLGCGILSGPLGVLFMFSMLERPARVTCPACRRMRVVTRDYCEFCSAAHTPPAADGTEVFETAATEFAHAT